MSDEWKTCEGSSQKKAEFPDRLRVARKRRKMSQSDLAEKTGFQPSAISHFETGHRSPSFDNLNRLADALDVTADYLLGRSDDPCAIAELQAETERLRNAPKALVLDGNEKATHDIVKERLYKGIEHCMKCNINLKNVNNIIDRALAIPKPEKPKTAAELAVEYAGGRGIDAAGRPESGCVMKRVHVCLDIRGALWNRSFHGFVNDDGTPATHRAAFEMLCDELARGHRLMPMNDCDNFDYQTGCRGHEETAGIDHAVASAAL